MKALDQEVLEKFIQKFGKIYEFQLEVAKEILEGKHTLIIAPTGYGKTFAAMLPIFSKLKNDKNRGIKALYVTPLKALNRDIFKQLASFADSIDISMDVRHGDTTAHAKRLQSNIPPDILVTTPETLQGILTGKKLREHLRKLKFVIVDEIHELFTSKRGSQLTVALERLSELSAFQRVGISATIGDEVEISKFLTGGKPAKIVKVKEAKEYDIKIITPSPSKTDKDVAKELMITQSAAFNINKIIELSKYYNRILVFVNTREMAELLGLRLNKLGVNVGVHHSSLSKTKRLEVESKFKKGEIKILVATSSLELGIDIGDIDLVMQYSSPRQVTKLVQRVGRAGHKRDVISNGVILVQDEDDYFESLAILEKVSEGWLEKPLMPKTPLDVLAHQIIGYLLTQSRSPKSIYSSIKKAYPFNNLNFEEFLNVVNLLKSIGLLYERDGFLIKSRRGLKYYYDSISMIPDEKNFIVKDAEMNKRVGILHQNFVVNRCEIGKVIVMQGTPWVITDIKGSTIEVVRSDSAEGAIPSWEGELIPVSREVAETSSTLKKKAFGPETPNKNLITIEQEKNIIVVNACYGSKINEALSKVLGSLISSRIGSSINTKVDPYRIMFELPKGEAFDLSPNLLKSLSPDWVDYIIKTSLKNSSEFLFSFYRTAKRFGLISKDADFSHSLVRRLIDTMRGSVVEKEVFKDLFREKIDVEGLKDVLSKINNNEIKVIKRNKLSKTSILGLQKSSLGSFIKPEFAYSELVDLVDRRLSEKKVYLVCMHCNNPIGTYRVKSIPKNFKCPYCKAKTIGFITESMKKRGNKKITSKRLEETSELFLNYGPLACYVMAAYGIGPTKAKQILSKHYKSKKDLVLEIIKAEREFIKNRRYWI